MFIKKIKLNQWDFITNSSKLIVKESEKKIFFFEFLHVQNIPCIAFKLFILFYFNTLAFVKALNICSESYTEMAKNIFWHVSN